MKILSDYCAVEGCSRSRARQSNGSRHRYCVAHKGRWERHRDVQADVPIGSPRWRPDQWCSYETAHRRTACVRGKASTHPCIDCAGPAREWSYSGGAAYEFTGPSPRGHMRIWSGDPADYEPRCKRCHEDHDREQRRAKQVAS